jgi:hypothetical protein
LNSCIFNSNLINEQSKNHLEPPRWPAGIHVFRALFSITSSNYGAQPGVVYREPTVSDRVEPPRTYEYREYNAPVAYPAVQGSEYRQVSYSNYPPVTGNFKYIQSNDESIAMLKGETRDGKREEEKTEENTSSKGERNPGIPERSKGTAR